MLSPVKGSQEDTHLAFFGSVPEVGSVCVGVKQRGWLFAFCGTKGCLACAGDV